MPPHKAHQSIQSNYRMWSSSCRFHTNLVRTIRNPPPWFQFRFQRTHHLRAEDVLYRIRITIDVARCDIGVFDQIHFPQPVVARDARRFTKSRFRKPQKAPISRVFQMIFPARISHQTRKFPARPTPQFEHLRQRHRFVSGRISASFQYLIRRPQKMLPSHPAPQSQRLAPAR